MRVNYSRTDPVLYHCNSKWGGPKSRVMKHYNMWYLQQSAKMHTQKPTMLGGPQGSSTDHGCVKPHTRGVIFDVHYEDIYPVDATLVQESKMQLQVYKESLTV